MLSTIKKHATWKKVIIFFIITQIVYIFMLQVTIPMTMEYSGGMKLLDMQPLGYSAEYAEVLLQKLGPEGRSFYLTKQIPVDMVYPFLFALSFSLLLTFLFNKSFKKSSKIHNLAIIPIIAGLFDYLENIGIIIMISTYPNIQNLAKITNIFSILKSLFTTVMFILIIITIILLTIKKIRKISDLKK